MKTGNTYDFRVEPQDVDFTLHATVTSMCNAILNTAGVDAQRNGLGVDVLTPKNRSWVLSRLAVEFDRLPEQYTYYKIRTWVNDDGRLVSLRNFMLTDDEDNVFGRVASQWCMIDFARRTPVDLREIADVYLPLMSEEPSPCDKPRKVRPAEPQSVCEHRVVYSDIDFNRHVNTMRYIDMMFDMFPIDTFDELRPFRLDIQFVKEARYGQTLIVGLERQNDLSLFEIKSDDGATVCRAAIEWR